MTQGRRLIVVQAEVHAKLHLVHRLREPEIRRRFKEAFQIERVVPGREPPGAAWFYLQRR